MTQEDLYALLPFVLLALVFWFLVFRPARKRQRETMQTQSSLEVGVRVMLTSGIFAEVVAMDDTSVEVEIAPGTVISVHRQAIGKVLPAEEATEDAVGAAGDDADDVNEVHLSGTETDTASESADSQPDIPTHQEK